jgi:hypothetical protein
MRVGVAMGVLLTMSAAGHPPAEPLRVNYCDVVASPADYNRKALLVEVLLSPSDHSLSLYGAACAPKEGVNITTQAVLPASWQALPNGKKLEAILRHHRNARVELVGTFESDGGPYGPDVARFRFSVSQVSSVAVSKK